MSSRFVALPVPAEINAGLVRHGQFRDARQLLAIADAAGVLAPCGFLRVAKQVDAADVVMVSDLATAKAREVFLSLIRAGAIERIGLAMVDPLHFKLGVQAVP